MQLAPGATPAGADRLGWLVDSGARSQFNPLAELSAHPLGAWSFLVIRFLGLVVVIAPAEELFLRGFVMRFITADDWWRLPLGA